MYKRIIPLVIFLSFINAQIALPTFQAVHKPHTAVAVAESDSQTFSYTGAEQTLTVPSGVESITIVAYGAQGGFDGSIAGGLGGYSTGTVSVTPGNTIYIYVGGQGTSGNGGIACNLAGGWNGGGDTGNCCGGGGVAGGGAGAGGGASDVRIGGNNYSNRVIVAGGGGGAGSNRTGAYGGGATGGATGSYAGVQTTGGTQSAGGQGGGHYSGCNPEPDSESTDGALGTGGRGDGNDGGGGGGGYYGGGGGANNYGGGGGSGYIGGVSNSTIIAGDSSMPDPDGGTMTGREGNGLVVISW